MTAPEPADGGEQTADVYAVVSAHPNGNKRPSASYLEALLDEATDGPWTADQGWLRGPRDVFLGGFGHGDIGNDEKVANAHLCALARRLAEEVLELRAASDRSWAEKFDGQGDPTPPLSGCRCGQVMCPECGEGPNEAVPGGGSGRVL